MERCPTRSVLRRGPAALSRLFFARARTSKLGPQNNSSGWNVHLGIRRIGSSYLLQHLGGAVFVCRNNPAFRKRLDWGCFCCDVVHGCSNAQECESRHDNFMWTLRRFQPLSSCFVHSISSGADSSYLPDGRRMVSWRGSYVGNPYLA